MTLVPASSQSKLSLEYQWKANSFFKLGIQGLELWCPMPPSKIFQLWWSVLLMEVTSSTSRKTTDLPQVTDKLYHIMLYWVHLAWVGFKH